MAGSKRGQRRNNRETGSYYERMAGVYLTEKGYEISFTNSALKQQLHVLFEYETTKILCTYESQKGVPPAEKIDPLMQYRGAVFDPTGISDTIATIQMFLKFGRTGFSQG